MLLILTHNAIHINIDIHSVWELIVMIAHKLVVSQFLGGKSLYSLTLLNMFNNSNNCHNYMLTNKFISYLIYLITVEVHSYGKFLCNTSPFLNFTHKFTAFFLFLHSDSTA